MNAARSVVAVENVQQEPQVPWFRISVREAQFLVHFADFCKRLGSFDSAAASAGVGLASCTVGAPLSAICFLLLWPRRARNSFSLQSAYLVTP